MQSSKTEMGSLSLHSPVNYEIQPIGFHLVDRPKVDRRKPGSG